MYLKRTEENKSGKFSKLFFVVIFVMFLGGCSQSSKNENTKGTVVTIALKAWNGKYVSLCNDTTGFKLIANAEKIGDREKFRMEYFETNVVILKAINNFFVCADYNKGNFLLADKMEAREWERYTIEDKGNNLVAFKASNDTYVCADNNIGLFLVANRGTAAEWETFTIEKIQQ